MKLREYLTRRFGLPDLPKVSVLFKDLKGDDLSEADWDVRAAKNKLVGDPRIGLFEGFDQNEIDKVVAQWAVARGMIERAITDVGVHDRFGLSNYEKLFGKYSLGSGAGYALRKAFVSETLSQMRDDMQQCRWHFSKNNLAGAAATHSGGKGSFRLALGEVSNVVHASVIIHEVAHNAGMEDVCEECSKELLAKKDRNEIYPSKLTGTPPKCKQNEAHGRIDETDENGKLKKCSLLAGREQPSWRRHRRISAYGMQTPIDGFATCFARTKSIQRSRVCRGSCLPGDCVRRQRFPEGPGLIVRPRYAALERAFGPGRARGGFLYHLELLSWAGQPSLGEPRAPPAGPRPAH